jgi:hypothetical protein
MTARWAFAPVCGFDFWRVIVTSPEVLIFLFFMITDPKTVPAGRVARVVFALLVGVLSVLLMAPQTTEFGAKVGLLSSLALMSVVRPLIERFLPDAGSDADNVEGFARGLVTGGARAGAARGGARVAVGGVAVLVVGFGIAAAGTPARGIVPTDTTELLDRVPHEIDPGTFPTVTVASDVRDWDQDLAGPGAQQVVLTLAENLELERQALLRKDEAILSAVDHGDRLAEMQKRLRDAVSSGRTMVAHYDFDDLNVILLQPFGVQTGLSLGFEARGTMTEEVYDAGGTLQAQTESPFELTFVMRRATGARWLNVAVMPEGTGG